MPQLSEFVSESGLGDCGRRKKTASGSEASSLKHNPKEVSSQVDIAAESLKDCCQIGPVLNYKPTFIPKWRCPGAL